ncbi:prepilin peptidase [Pantoea dispersa]|uniref:prepilin peptidase n=1 Tax=Pantoea dispersa TaxID=59814 RepID=UPI002DBA9236|nr:prepilin peptidase [Pantoea dispersa]MEB5836741.1 prepilin peptidase [Pantoea dispersa]
MEIAYWLIGTLLALCVGSFLNVVIYRLPQQVMNPQPGIPLLLPRSHCPHCQTTLRASDMLPLLSWLLLRGRCRYCHHPVSLRYPLTELLTAAISLALAWLLPPDSRLPAALLLAWILLALTLIDIEHLLMPDALTLSLLWLGLLFKALYWLPGTLNDAVFGAIAGYSTLWLMGELYQLINKRPGLGGGDAKLLAALGAWLGWALLPFVLLLACTGAILFVLLARLGWQRELYHVLPFGPWLALAGISLFIHTII